MVLYGVAALAAAARSRVFAMLIYCIGQLCKFTSYRSSCKYLREGQLLFPLSN